LLCPSTIAQGTPSTVEGCRPAINRELRPDDRFETGLRRGLMKSRRAIHAVGVEQRDRRIAERRRALDERFGQRRALQKAECRCGMKFDIHGGSRGVECEA